MKDIVTRTNEEKIAEIEEHLKCISDILGIRTTESNKDTPKRVAKMYVNELFENVDIDSLKRLDEAMTTFENKGNYSSEMVIMKDIDFNSICEHHWLPFSGKVSVGYIPNTKVIGLSKIPRVVKHFSRMPQLQEQLTSMIGYYLFDEILPKAVFVKVEAVHQCVKCRGAESDCTTVTYFKLGALSDNELEDNFKQFKEEVK